MTIPDPPQPPDGERKRMSTTVRLTLLGVGAVVALYSCVPAVSGGFGWLPYFWLFSNHFRGAGVQAPGSGSPVSPSQAQPSQRGGFGESAGKAGSGSS